MLDLPGSDWERTEKIPTPGDVAFKLKLSNKKTNGNIIIRCAKLNVAPSQIAELIKRMEDNSISMFNAMSWCREVKYCDDILVPEGYSDSCIEIRIEAGEEKATQIQYKRLYSVDKIVHFIGIDLSSLRSATHDKNLITFIDMLRSLRHGKEHTGSK